MEKKFVFSGRTFRCWSKDRRRLKISLQRQDVRRTADERRKLTKMRGARPNRFDEGAGERGKGEKTRTKKKRQRRALGSLALMVSPYLLGRWEMRGEDSGVPEVVKSWRCCWGVVGHWKLMTRR